MTDILLCGACGKMGKMITDCAKNYDNCKIVCGVDRTAMPCDFPLFDNFSDINIKPDVIIDFSNVAVLDSLLDYATSNNIPVVIATTGYTQEQIQKIKDVSKKIPVFFTFNMSLGINLLCALSKKAASVLGDNFDIEIIEKHHNQKLDAPSGTAIMLADSINEELGNKLNYEYDRHSKRAKRPKNEIGIHSVRGGTIVGEHEVIFAGNDEVISLSHSASSKAVFANGAIKASIFLAKQTAGLYDMNDLLNN